MTPISQSHEQAVNSCRAGVWLVFQLITVSAVVIGFVFFTGWAYAYHYFAPFNVGLVALKLPAVTFLGFSFWVFQTWWWLLIPYAVALVLLAIYEPRLATGWARLKAHRPLLLTPLAVIVTLAAFLVAWWVAAISAGRYFEEQQARQFSDLPLVRVWLNESPADETLQELYRELPQGVYRVLLEDRERLFLFKLPPAGQPTRMTVIELPWREVKLVQVLP